MTNSPRHDQSTSPAPETAWGKSDDSVAIQRTLAGDRRAFEGVVTQHERAVYMMLHRMTANTEDAEDLTQETFLRAYRALAKFDRTRPFRPWILRMAANAATEHARRKGRCFVVMIEDLESAEGAVVDHTVVPPSDVQAARQEQALLQRAVDTLRGESAALYHLHFREHFAVETIAETLGKRPNTIAVALHRLRHHLRRLVHAIIAREESP